MHCEVVLARHGPGGGRRHLWTHHETKESGDDCVSATRFEGIHRSLHTELAYLAPALAGRELARAAPARTALHIGHKVLTKSAAAIADEPCAGEQRADPLRRSLPAIYPSYHFVSKDIELREEARDTIAQRWPRQRVVPAGALAQDSLQGDHHIMLLVITYKGGITVIGRAARTLPRRPLVDRQIGEAVGGVLRAWAHPHIGAVRLAHAPARAPAQTAKVFAS